MSKKEEYIKAVALVIKELKSKKDMYLAWQSSIAMAFKDEYAKKSYGPKNRETIHLIANEAAKIFLNQLINTKE